METTLDLFKKLKSFSEPELQSEILKHAKFLKANKGDILIKEGQYLNFLPIVIDGLLRVYQQNEDREILLYYVGPEQTCMMSLSSAYFDYYSTANGIAMEPSEILVLPAHLIAEWQLKYPSWNKFIINTYKSRYDELLNAFYLSGMSGKSRGVNEADLKDKPAEFAIPKVLLQLSMDSDRMFVY